MTVTLGAVTEPTVPVELARAVVGFAVRRGLDPDVLLAGAGISSEVLGEGRSRLTESQAVRLVQGLWRRTDDEMFGMGPAPLPRGSFRLIAYGLMSAPDLRVAMGRAAGFLQAVPALPSLQSRIEGDSVTVEIHLPPGSDPDGTVARVAFLTVHRFLGWLVGGAIQLDGLTLPVSPWLGEEIHRLLFGVREVWTLPDDGTHPSMCFPVEVLSLPIVRTASDLEEFVESSPAGFMRRHAGAVTTGDRVRRLCSQGLQDGEIPSAEQMARSLAMSPATLRRQLAEEDVSIRTIREELLRDAAVTALVRGEESVAQISQRLGFSEPSAFTRAFRRWTGNTPGAYRSVEG